MSLIDVVRLWMIITVSCLRPDTKHLCQERERERGDVLILSPASYAMPISPLSSDTQDPSDSVEKCAMAWNKTVSVVIRI